MDVPRSLELYYLSRQHRKEVQRPSISEPIRRQQEGRDDSHLLSKAGYLIRTSLEDNYLQLVVLPIHNYSSYLLIHDYQNSIQ